ncbi:reverse transcriptase family protein [Paenibacillus hunanensis]|uniref:reverse transcriptase family protein n=1 Tax=Paenibacillus hunanensis TaxID=539262 RepID=UPI002A6A2D90|nr:reverse transcriptase family protein [Paenibacillus hunanensis]WPP41336.1 reverse transcriptase family protein [Paenibacillus hunanensis]
MDIKKLEKRLQEENYGIKYQELCLNYAGNLLNNGLPVIFDKRHLSLLMGIEENKLNYYMLNTDKFYKKNYILKSNGKKREILMPSFHLKELQRWILDNILYCYYIHPAAFGFVPNKSIKDNAILHINQSVVINFDLENFFPNIELKKIFRIFYNSGYTKEVSYCLAKLCSYNGFLPQGSPASPFLANISCIQLDKRLEALVHNLGFKYSRYADDITFSGNHNIKGLIPSITNIIKEEDFKINLSKLRVQDNNPHKEITGLIVSDSVKVKKKYKVYLSKQIYYAKKFGVYSHLQRINAIERSYYKEHLYGMANFIKMIEEEEGEKFLKELSEISWNY